MTVVHLPTEATSLLGQGWIRWEAVPPVYDLFMMVLLMTCPRGPKPSIKNRCRRPLTILVDGKHSSTLLYRKAYTLLDSKPRVKSTLGVSAALEGLAKSRHRCFPSTAFTAILRHRAVSSAMNLQLRVARPFRFTLITSTMLPTQIPSQGLI